MINARAYPSDFATRLDAVWEILQQAAASGERCPTGDSIDYALEKRGLSRGRECLGELVRAGKIKVEISGNNWRVVEILTGPLKGKRTAENPRSLKPYRILDKNGDHWLTRGKTLAPRAIS